jgi:NADH-quinone oxidoreductase subunit J
VLLETLFFYAFALMAILGGVLTVTRRNAVHSAIALIVSLMGVAGLFLLQKAEFLFAVQIILYIGGIMVLFLFVIMLVNLDEAAKQRQFHNQWAVALACTAGVGALAAWFAFRGATSFPWAVPVDTVPALSNGNTEAIADVLFRHYLLPFELASLLLLVAVVGAVFLARKGKEA